MPKDVGVQGTGITAKAVLQFDWGNPTDFSLLQQAAMRTFDEAFFSRLTAGIARNAELVLRQARLPTDAAKFYVVHEGKKWFSIGAEVADQNKLSLAELLDVLGYQNDSPEGYAARALCTIAEANEFGRQGRRDEAMAKAFKLGSLINEAGMKETWEQDALRGEKTLRASQQGHEAVQGTQFAKKQRFATYVRGFRECLAQGIDRMTAYQQVANKHGVTRRTIERAVERAQK